VSNSPKTNIFRKPTLLEMRPCNFWTYKIDQASENGRLYSVGVPSTGPVQTDCTERRVLERSV
jgi:hypothetical protein